MMSVSFKEIQIVESKETSVKKFVFTREDAVAETVLYKYPTYAERTVICCSTQSGCPVGCRFCGAGDYFVKSLTSDEIIEQVDFAINHSETPASEMKRLQIMFMSMGEPLLNKRGMIESLEKLNNKYQNAALLISTIGPKIDYSWLMEISHRIDKVGLQFSIHKSTDEERDKLIPFKKKLKLSDISVVGETWYNTTGRKPFFNYCADDDNTSDEDVKRLKEIFDPSIWECTVSVICERNEGLPAKNEHQMELANNFSSKMVEAGYNVRVFDPAGQDDIGGGCGQLWFVQDWMKNNTDKAIPSVGNGLPKLHVPKK